MRKFGLSLEKGNNPFPHISRFIREEYEEKEAVIMRIFGGEPRRGFHFEMLTIPWVFLNGLFLGG